MRRPLLLLLGGLAAAPALVAAEGRVGLQLKDAQGEPVEHAVVSLHPLDQPAPPPAAAAAPAEVSQDNEEFDPYVSVVRAGTEVAFPNQDRVQHHIYSVSPAKRFQKPLYSPGARETVVFDQPGVVTLGCNIHDWMVAYLVVVDTPWFARTGREGRAEVTGVPPGRYRLEIWHPRLTEVDSRTRQKRPVTRELTVAAGGQDESLQVTLGPDRRIRRSPAGKNGRY